MNLKNYIYPKVKIDKGIVNSSYDRVRILTFLRKKHTDEKWYLVPVIYHYSLNRNIEECLNQFHALVYSTLIASVIIPDMKDHLGHEIVLLDDNQQDEIERVRNMFKPELYEK